MNINFGKLAKNLLNHFRGGERKAQAPVIESKIFTDIPKAKSRQRGLKNLHAADNVKRVRRKMATRSRTINSMRRRGKLYA